MEIKNPLYKNIGAHVINTVFTIDKGKIKVLLIKRNNEPFKGKWALPGGAMYNNELIEDAAKRELKEKTSITNVDLIFAGVEDKIDRSPLLRMLAFIYIGLVDIEKVNILKETNKTLDAEWFSISNIPELAYDHNQVLLKAIEKLKDMIISSNILKKLYPNGFTIPEIHKVYEEILGIEIDRINFEGKKPAKKYMFNEEQKDKRLF